MLGVHSQRLSGQLGKDYPGSLALRNEAETLDVERLSGDELSGKAEHLRSVEALELTDPDHQFFRRKRRLGNGDGRSPMRLFAKYDPGTARIRNVDKPVFKACC